MVSPGEGEADGIRTAPFVLTHAVITSLVSAAPATAIPDPPTTSPSTAPMASDPLLTLTTVSFQTTMIRRIRVKDRSDHWESSCGWLQRHRDPVDPKPGRTGR